MGRLHSERKKNSSEEIPSGGMRPRIINQLFKTHLTLSVKNRRNRGGANINPLEKNVYLVSGEVLADH